MTQWTQYLVHAIQRQNYPWMHEQQAFFVRDLMMGLSGWCRKTLTSVQGLKEHFKSKRTRPNFKLSTFISNSGGTGTNMPLGPRFWMSEEIVQNQCKIVGPNSLQERSSQPLPSTVRFNLITQSLDMYSAATRPNLTSTPLCRLRKAIPSCFTDYLSWYWHLGQHATFLPVLTVL